MRIEPFRMERWQSLHEHQVEINLSDSGVHPLSVGELIEQGESDVSALIDQRLIYTHTNGSPELRERIAALHPGVGTEQVLVVNGGAEANLIATWSLLEPGDEAVVMLPNYMQIPGLARGLGATLRPWRLEPDLDAGRWVASLEALEALVNPRTRFISICNPNNPTGARLDAGTLDTICEIAGRHGAWVLSDEIYRGSELDGQETASAWGRYERVVVTNSLSKAYGLPGLRLGWIVAERGVCARFWAHHDYTTIGPGALSDLLARHALEPERRRSLIERSRGLLRENYARCAAWLERSGGSLRHVPPEAGAMLFLRYDHRINSTQLAIRLRDEQSVLVVPGDHYDMDGWLRVCFGGEPAEMERGLERIEALLATVEV